MTQPAVRPRRSPRRHVLLAAVALAGSAPWASPPTVAEPGAPPNIVLVVTDDQSFESIRHMPFLADSGWATFDTAVVNTPACCPSRASIFTGQYSRHTMVETNVSGRAFDEAASIAASLDSAGYRTGLFGKYLNYYPFREAPFTPQGWDEFLAHIDTPPGFFDYSLYDNGSVVRRGTAPEDYSVDVLAERAEQFVRGADGPFFAYFAPYAPHAPYTPAPRHAGAYADLEFTEPPNFYEPDVSDKPAVMGSLPELTDPRRERAGQIYRSHHEALLSVDDAVRRLAEAVPPNTYIIFTSDNGFSFGSHRFIGKFMPYEESVRVPLLVRTPDGAGGNIPALVSNVDIAPTIADAAGIPFPHRDGRSLLPLLSGAAESVRDEVLLEHVPGRWVGLRTPGWKYIEYETGERELYDLDADPFELDNRAGDPAYGEVVADLARRLDVERGRSPAPVLNVSDAVVTEPDEGEVRTASVTVTRSGSSALPAEVTVRPVPGTASGGDYAATEQRLHIPAGSRSATASVDVVGDAAYEGDETLSLVLSGPDSAVLGRHRRSTVTIVDDEGPRTISVGDARVVEGDSGTSAALQFPLTLDGPAPTNVSATWRLRRGTATPTTDVVGGSGVAVIEAGSVSTSVSVAVRGDVVAEPDETLQLEIVGPSGAVIADNAGLGTIVDDDGLPSIAVGDVTVAEAAGTATVPVTLSIPSAVPVSAAFTTAGRTAQSPADFATTSGRISIPAGETAATISVPVVDDVLAEAPETFRVAVSSIVNANTGDTTGVVTILDDELPGASPPPGLSVADVAVHEGEPFAAVTVSLDGTSPNPVTFTLATTPGTATPGEDFVSSRFAGSIAPGERTATFEIPILDDEVFEPDQAVLVDLTDAVGAGLADARGVIRILDDRAPLTVRVGDAWVAEGDDAAPRTVAVAVDLSAPAPQALSLPWRLAASATPGSDYADALGTVAFAPGEQRAWVEITVMGDLDGEPQEWVNVVVSGLPAGDTVGRVRIADDDGRVVPRLVGSTVSEAGPISFDVLLSTPAKVELAVAYSSSDRSATAGTDYEPATGTVAFAPGEVQATIALLSVDDQLVEPDETVGLTASLFGPAVSTVAVVLDDDQPEGAAP